MDDGDIAAERAERWLELDLAAAAAQEKSRQAAARKLGTQGKKPGLKVECAECGCTIPTARLVAVPGAKLCGECATHEEQEQARLRRLKGHGF